MNEACVDIFKDTIQQIDLILAQERSKSEGGCKPVTIVFTNSPPHQNIDEVLLKASRGVSLVIDRNLVLWNGSHN